VGTSAVDAHEVQREPGTADRGPPGQVDEAGRHLTGSHDGEAPRVQRDELGQELGAHAGAVAGDRVHDEAEPLATHRTAPVVAGTGRNGRVV